MYIDIARAIGGLASILVLLGLLTLQVIEPDVEVGWPEIFLIVAMISALLGVDILSQLNEDD